MEKTATLLAYLLSKLINEQGGIFRLLHEKLQAGWKGNLKNLSEHALLLGTSEYTLYIQNLEKCCKYQYFVARLYNQDDISFLTL